MQQKQVAVPGEPLGAPDPKPVYIKYDTCSVYMDVFKLYIYICYIYIYIYIHIHIAVIAT